MKEILWACFKQHLQVGISQHNVSNTYTSKRISISDIGFIGTFGQIASCKHCSLCTICFCFFCEAKLCFVVRTKIGLCKEKVKLANVFIETLQCSCQKTNNVKMQRNHCNCVDIAQFWTLYFHELLMPCD